MAADQGPEPTGWELMRGLTEVKEAIKELGADVLPISVYNEAQRGNTQRHERAEARIKDLEQNATESEKLRRSTRLAISLAIASPIVTLLVGYLTNHAGVS
jgi:hypothetical protein